jgi:hypothetical protein
MDGNHRKARAGKFGWRWGNECSFLLQVTKMIVDVKGLLD